MLIDSPKNKQKIYEKFLELCQDNGWNQDSLNQALKECKIDPNLSGLIFENGPLDLANIYIEKQNEQSNLRLKKIKNFKGAKIRDKIRFSLYARFEVEKDNKLILQRLSRYYLSCKNLTNAQQGMRPVISGLAFYLKIADFIWKNIGDTSTDFNFYSKRLTLSKILFLAFMVFYDDESDDLFKTKELIDKQIDKVMSFEKFKSSLKDKSFKAKSMINDFILDDNGNLKEPSKIFKQLPFIRLFS